MTVRLIPTPTPDDKPTDLGPLVTVLIAFVISCAAALAGVVARIVTL